ncbi:MAG: hypothetical protein ABR998_10560 [Gemmatimonadales bacterium]|jgi:TM2 domain-containing membrane protein YozV
MALTRSNIGFLVMLLILQPVQMACTARDAFAQGNVAGQQLIDVVYLKDGSVIRGIIVESIPGHSILIETFDGNRFRYQLSDVEKMTREPDPRRAAAQQAAEQAAGQSVRTVQVGDRKSPAAAWAWSFFIPGAGQIYNGNTGTGLLQLGLSVLLTGAAGSALQSDQCVNGGNCSDALGLFGAAFGVWVWAQVDAYQSAKAINERLAREGLSLLPAPGPRIRVSGYRVVSLDIPILRWTVH